MSFQPSASTLSLLKTNDPPSNISLLVSSRNAVSSYASTLSSQITSLKTELSLLSQKHTEACSHVQNYNTILHPIRRLPPEVLAEIFISTSADLTNPLCMKEPPWILAQVCHRWRSIALSLPKLYSSLALRLDLRATEASAKAVSILAEYLVRSGSYPLTICVFSDFTPNHPLLSLLYSYSHRWKKAFLSLSLKGFHALSGLVRGGVPILEVLSIYARIQPGETRRTWNATKVVDAFEYAPALHTLYVKSVPFLGTSFVLPWEKIKKFHWITNSDPSQAQVLVHERTGDREWAWKARNEELVGMLRKMSVSGRLRECVLDCWYDQDLDLSPSSPVYLPHLESLTLMYTGPPQHRTNPLNQHQNPQPPPNESHVTQILQSMTTPSLQTLHVFPKVRQGDAQALVGLAERSRSPLSLSPLERDGHDKAERCKITRLGLHRTPSLGLVSGPGSGSSPLFSSSPTKIDEVVLMRRAFSHLEVLACKLTETLLRGMVPSETCGYGDSEEGDPVLPSLKVLKVFSQPDAEVQRLLVGMLESRNGVEAGIGDESDFDDEDEEESSEGEVSMEGEMIIAEAEAETEDGISMDIDPSASMDNSILASTLKSLSTRAQSLQRHRERQTYIQTQTRSSLVPRPLEQISISNNFTWADSGLKARFERLIEKDSSRSGSPSSSGGGSSSKYRTYRLVQPLSG
ncbi:hypothetical protein VKT23_008027 [Stygiomarasmius scandens]|uniref:F-box domain-containing protein n=1 Tax=Marasmiellus scandens TaxID=2682957 RepID=A0ABR1JLM3_9AGAR